MYIVPEKVCVLLCNSRCMPISNCHRIGGMSLVFCLSMPISNFHRTGGMSLVFCFHSKILLTYCYFFGCFLFTWGSICQTYLLIYSFNYYFLLLFIRRSLCFFIYAFSICSLFSAPFENSTATTCKYFNIINALYFFSFKSFSLREKTL